MDVIIMIATSYKNQYKYEPKWLTLILNFNFWIIINDLLVSIMVALCVSISGIAMCGGLIMLVNWVKKSLHVYEGNYDCLLRAAELFLAHTKILANANDGLLSPIINSG